MDRPQGTLIAIEGIDAVGKRTQSSLLTSWLKTKGVALSTFSFPDYGTTIGREIKSYLAGERSYSAEVGHMLYAVNRWEKKSEIDRALRSSALVVVNRYSASNYAYGTAKGLDLNWLMNLEEGLPKPDLVVVLDAPPSTLAYRRGANKDTYERNIELQEKVRDAYLRLGKEFGWLIIDAERGILSTNSTLRAAFSEILSSKGRTV